MRHLLVTNDYPPKVGGIQNYLWELYRRLPPDEVVVLTRPHPGWRAFDEAQDHRIIRVPQPVLIPEPWLAHQINEVVASEEIGVVMYDPAFPLGALAPRMDHRYGVILHGAELAFPGRVQGTRQIVGEVLRKASLVVTAGDYSTIEAERAAGGSLPIVEVPPGVDIDFYRPSGPDERAAARRAFGIEDGQVALLTLSRLVPRKGMDRVIEAAARLAPTHPELVVLVAGSGRDRRRLERLAARTGAPVRFLGRVPEETKPALYGACDVFAMLCRVRWGGLEQEGFGIVFLEAAACGVPQIAGRSGGSAEAVAHGESGVVVDRPDDPAAVAAAIAGLVDDASTRAAMGEAARRRAAELFSYDLLAARYRDAVRAAAG